MPAHLSGSAGSFALSLREIIAGFRKIRCNKTKDLFFPAFTRTGPAEAMEHTSGLPVQKEVRGRTQMRSLIAGSRREPRVVSISYSSKRAKKPLIMRVLGSFLLSEVSKTGFACVRLKLPGRPPWLSLKTVSGMNLFSAVSGGLNKRICQSTSIC